MQLLTPFQEIQAAGSRGEANRREPFFALMRAPDRSIGCHARSRADLSSLKCGGAAAFFRQVGSGPPGLNLHHYGC